VGGLILKVEEATVQPLDSERGFARISLAGPIIRDDEEGAFHDLGLESVFVTPVRHVGEGGDYAARIRGAARELNSAMEEAARFGLVTELSIIHTHVLAAGPSHERVGVRVVREL